MVEVEERLHLVPEEDSPELEAEDEQNQNSVLVPNIKLFSNGKDRLQLRNTLRGLNLRKRRNFALFPRKKLQGLWLKIRSFHG